MPNPDYFSTQDAPDLPVDILSDIAKLKTWVADAPIDDLIRASRGFHAHKVREREVVDTELAHRRHLDIQKQFADLKRPHWTVLPIFWITLLAAVAAVFAAYYAWLAVQPSGQSTPASFESKKVQESLLKTPAHISAPATAEIPPSPKQEPAAIQPKQPKTE